MPDQTIEQRLETSLRDVFFKGRRSMELEIETKGKAILLPISSEIKASKSVLLQLITEAEDKYKDYKSPQEVSALLDKAMMDTKAFITGKLTPKENK